MTNRKMRQGYKEPNVPGTIKLFVDSSIPIRTPLIYVELFLVENQSTPPLLNIGVLILDFVSNCQRLNSCKFCCDGGPQESLMRHS